MEVKSQTLIQVKLVNLLQDSDWKDLIIRLKRYFPNYMRDDSMVQMGLVNLIRSFQLQYNNNFVRYNKESFCNYWIKDMIEYYPNLFFKQRSYMDDELLNLIKAKYRGSQYFQNNNSQDNITALREHIEALSNTGDQGDVSLKFDNKKDTLVRKIFNNANNTSNENRTSNSDRQSYNLFLNLVEITNSVVNYGVHEVLMKFSDYFQIFYV